LEICEILAFGLILVNIKGSDARIVFSTFLLDLGIILGLGGVLVELLEVHNLF